MENPELPPEVFLNMVSKGALTPGEDDKSFEINFYIVNKHFSSYMNTMVERSLNDIERWAYLEGYMYYTVLEDGQLQWRPTNRRFNK